MSVISVLQRGLILTQARAEFRGRLLHGRQTGAAGSKASATVVVKYVFSSPRNKGGSVSDAPTKDSIRLCDKLQELMAEINHTSDAYTFKLNKELMLKTKGH